MIDISKMKVGDKVYYQPSHYQPDKWENGMVKEIPEHSLNSIRVVYNCNEDWKNFRNYTSALTNISDLKLGWKSEVEETKEEPCDHYYILTNSKWQSEFQKKCQFCNKTIE